MIFEIKQQVVWCKFIYLIKHLTR